MSCSSTQSGRSSLARMRAASRWRPGRGAEVEGDAAQLRFVGRAQGLEDHGVGQGGIGPS